MVPFSVVMSVYRNDKPPFVQRAIESIYNLQTLKPNEIVVVVDGPIPDDLKTTIKMFKQNAPDVFNIIWLPENKGLGNALRVGCETAKNEIIARMDSDDVSVPDRFEKQISFLEQNPDCDIVGGQMTEFIDSEDNIVGERNVPCDENGIKHYLRSRCPLNHVTVMMRKKAVMSVGNYLDWHFNEDYYLWIRMAIAGCKFANLPDTLVNVRVGKEMYQRRGGWRYFKSEKGLQDYMLKNRIISLPRYIYNVAGRFAIQVAIPTGLRGFIFQKLFRK